MPDETVTELAQILKERGERYGQFWANAEFVQQFCGVFQVSCSWYKFTASQKYAVMMIAAKFSRLATGDPTHIDSWDDIAGYAKLIADELRQRAQA